MPIAPVTITVEIPGDLAPSFRSAVEDYSQRLANQTLTGGPGAQERAQGRAIAAWVLLRKSVLGAIKRRDSDFAFREKPYDA
jgi:hypothetical protein